MLIEQIIKKQTISILDAILQTQSQQNNQFNRKGNEQQTTFTPESYAELYVQKGVIKDDQKQILLILINKHIESQNQNNEFQQVQPTFTFEDAYVMLKSIKRNIIAGGQSEKVQRKDDFQQKGLQSERKQKANNIKADKNNQKPVNQSSRDQTSNNTHRQNDKQTPNDQQMGIISKKLKKQNQFIARNIDRIKKYATNFSQAILPLDRGQLQQVKISYEISHKLFHLYRTVYPSAMSSNKQIQINKFETKEQYKSTLNYHKILQMLIDAPIKLEIENKLSLLRIIKKFAFNPNFIQLEEWTKIYRTIINNLGIKEILLQRLVKTKEQDKKNNKLPITIMASKQKPQKPEYRTRRIKTQVSIPEHRLTSLQNIENPTTQYQSQKSIQYMSNKSSIRPIEPQQKTLPKSYNPNEYRWRHKKLLTDVSQVFIKNVKKDMRSEKMIGLEDRKEDKNSSQVLGEDGKNEYSYLKKAIKNKKIGKITWESLFEMKEETMYHNIVIPDFAKLLDKVHSN